MRFKTRADHLLNRVRGPAKTDFRDHDVVNATRMAVRGQRLRPEVPQVRAHLGLRFPTDDEAKAVSDKARAKAREG